MDNHMRYVQFKRKMIWLLRNSLVGFSESYNDSAIALGFTYGLLRTVKLLSAGTRRMYYEPFSHSFDRQLPCSTMCATRVCIHVCQRICVLTSAKHGTFKILCFLQIFLEINASSVNFPLNFLTNLRRV